MSRVAFPRAPIYCTALFVLLPCEDAERSDSQHLVILADTTPVQGELVSAAPAIGQPRTPQIAGRTVWIVDAARDPAIHLIDIESGELVRSVGRTGAGPGEFAGAPATLHADPAAGSAVWAFDGAAQRLVRLVEAPQAQADSVPRTITLTGGPLYFKAIWLTESVGVGVSRDPERRLSLFDSTGAFVRAVAESPLGPETAPLAERVRATVTRFFVCPRPGGSHFAIAYGDAGRITIHDIGLSDAVVADVPEPADPIFERSTTTGQVHFQRRMLRYVGCSGTPDHLFALYSGRQYSRETAVEAGHGSTVHVFTWDGRLARVIRLDPAISGIAVNETETILVGVSLLDAGVYRYDLNRE